MKRPTSAILDACMCRCGRMKVLEDSHTHCTDQEAGEALMRCFDLIPCTAAGLATSGQRATAHRSCRAV